MTRQDDEIIHELKELLLAREDLRCNRISLLIAVREKFHLSLADAMNVIKEYETREGKLVQTTGLSAYIYAIGKFTKHLLEYLEYPASYYQNLPEGTPLIHRQFEVFRNTEECNRLAAAFGIDNPLDFNQHEINIAHIDYKQLAQCLADFGYESDEIQYELDHLMRFVEAQFQFMLMLTEINK